MATTAADPDALSPAVGAVTARDRVLVDTNVLAYASVPTAPFHAAAVAALHHLRRVGAELWTSRQVLREYVAVLTRPQPYAPPTPLAQALANVQRLETQLLVAEDGPLVFSQFLTLLAAVACGGRQVYDANIVATMLAHGIPNVLTHNIADFKRFAGHVTVLPLIPQPPPGVP
jgi:predicted nucleic acid-binding protein